MDQFYIRSNTGRISRLEKDVAALEAGLNPPIEADLDMRMNQDHELSAYHVINEYDEDMISKNSYNGNIYFKRC